LHPIFLLLLNHQHHFQRTLIVEIRTLVTWLKSTLLLKIKYYVTHNYMKTQFLQTKWDAALFGKGKDWVAGKERKVLALIKRLIYVREKIGALEELWKIDQNRSNL